MTLKEYLTNLFTPIDISYLSPNGNKHVFKDVIDFDPFSLIEKLRTDYFEEIDLLVDQAIKNNMISIFPEELEIKNLTIIFYDEEVVYPGDRYVPIIHNTNSEQGVTLFQYLVGFNGSTVDIDEMIKVLTLIMYFDCTGCCNAIEYLNISPYGIIAKSNTRKTYHS